MPIAISTSKLNHKEIKHIKTRTKRWRQTLACKCWANKIELKEMKVWLLYIAFNFKKKWTLGSMFICGIFYKAEMSSVELSK